MSRMIVTSTYIALSRSICVIYLRWLYKQGASELARYHYAKDFVLISQQKYIYPHGYSN